MKKRIILLLLCVLLCCSACASADVTPSATGSTQLTEAAKPTDPTAAPTVEPTQPTQEPTQAPTQVPTEPAHSPLYIEGVSVEDVIRYFNEVCLDAEYVNGGDASRVQKWMYPIYYSIDGQWTEYDMEVFRGFTAWLNTIEGCPGIYASENALLTNLSIHFCTSSELVGIMGDQFVGADGGVTFWYADDIIYNAIICYCNEIDQQVRNSVILEEIYNGLGPVQDTDLRPDSIIFSGYTQPQSLTAVDELLLRLLYHPDIRCGMNAAQCEAVIRSLYY